MTVYYSMSNDIQQTLNQTTEQGGLSGTVDTFTLDIIKIIQSVNTPSEVFTLLLLLVFLGWIAYLFFNRFKKVSGANGHSVARGKLHEEIFVQTERHTTQIDELREDMRTLTRENKNDHRAVMEKIDGLQDKLFSLALIQRPSIVEAAEEPKTRRIPVKKRTR